MTTADKSPLSHLTIGVSISESPDIEALGFSDMHFRDVFVEFARYLMACGATLAYGGDFRKGGFTEELIDLKATYKGNANKIVSYLGWPIHAEMDELSKEEQLRYLESAEFHRSPIPDGVDASIPRDKFLPPIKTDPAKMMIWARSMSKMRRDYLAAHNDAQILLGGRLEGFSSKYPGVVEEAYEIIRAEKPLFLIGAFGGATRAVIDAVRGRAPKSLTEAGQIELWEAGAKASGKPQDYKGLIDHFNAHAPASEERIDYSALTEFFHSQGIAGLRNQLSEAENERLFVTPHVSEMIALTLRGLSRIGGGA